MKKRTNDSLLCMRIRDKPACYKFPTFFNMSLFHCRYETLLKFYSNMSIIILKQYTDTQKCRYKITEHIRKTKNVDASKKFREVGAE
jgi:hypothetical protein